MPKTQPEKNKLLLTGATGYIGGRLLRKLESMDVPLRCMARNPEYLIGKVRNTTEVRRGDAFDQESLTAAFEGIHTAYFNIHSLGGDGDFQERDRTAALNFGQAAAKAGISKIIYLGGLGKGSELSKHLAR